MRSISLRLGGKRVLKIMNRSKDKGDAVVGTVVKLLKGRNVIARKSV